MEQHKIIEMTLEIYKKCNIKSFPIDCIKVIKALGIPIYKYSELPEHKIKKCFLISDDAFKLHGVIYYNDKYPHKERQRFSIMHEVGHIVLGHVGECYKNEKEADFFSSNFLAPRTVMWRLECESVKDICHTFNVSCMAANRIEKEYKIFCFWEHNKLNKSICDWFFPQVTPDVPNQTDEEMEYEEAYSNFFKTFRFLRGEGHIFERAEFYHLHGHDY